MNVTTSRLSPAEILPNNHPDIQYLALVEDILANGVVKHDRTGVGTQSVFGRHMAFDISDGRIPLLTTKKVFHRSVVHELLWMLSGSTNVKYLVDNNVTIWNAWVDPATAVYRHYTKEELIQVIEEAQLDAECQDYLQAHLVDTYPEIFENKDWISVSLFIDAMDKINDEWPAEDYRPLIDVMGLLAKFCEVCDLPYRQLVAGEVKNVYGKQWRRLPGIRIVPLNHWHSRHYAGYINAKQNGWVGSFGEFCQQVGVGVTDIAEDDYSREATRYRELGYQLKGDLTTGECVITREHDQISNLLRLLKEDPDSRRIMMDSWTVDDIDQSGLPPCHPLFQCWTRELTLNERLVLAANNNITVVVEDWLHSPEGDGEGDLHAFLDGFMIPKRELSSQIYFRSNDVALGNPFNIVQYALLTHLLAHECNMTTGELKWVGGDVHLYLDQMEGIAEQQKNEPMANTARVFLNPNKRSMLDFTFEDVRIVNYQSHEVIKFPAAAV